MTEIPEHLLKRSRERRAAIGKGGDDGGDGDGGGEAGASDGGGASGTPATTGSTAPAAPAATGPATRAAPPEPEAPQPPKPDPHYVAAAKQRRKVPWWAMATLSLMPIWGFMYVRAVTEPNEIAAGPLGVGAEVYGNCASCHGANGGGGLGYAFSEGEVLKTFPNIEDQIRYVFYGTDGYNLAGVDIYGNPDREGGAHITGAQGVMPAFGNQLAGEELLGVICHERYTLGGADPTSEEYAEEYDQWCSEDSAIFVELEAGEFTFDNDAVEPFLDAQGEEFEIEIIGSTPISGSP